MARFKWWKHKKQDPWKDIKVDQYTATFSGQDWRLGAGTGLSSATWTTTAEPIYTMGQYEPVALTPAVTTMTNTITIPHESVETAGGVHEFLMATMPDGYALLEYNSEMSEEMITITYSAHVSPVRTAQAVEFDRIEIDEDRLRGLFADTAIIDDPGYRPRPSSPPVTPSRRVA